MDVRRSSSALVTMALILAFTLIGTGGSGLAHGLTVESQIAFGEGDGGHSLGVMWPVALFRVGESDPVAGLALRPVSSFIGDVWELQLKADDAAPRTVKRLAPLWGRRVQAVISVDVNSSTLSYALVDVETDERLAAGISTGRDLERLLGDTEALRGGAALDTAWEQALAGLPQLREAPVYAPVGASWAIAAPTWKGSGYGYEPALEVAAGVSPLLVFSEALRRDEGELTGVFRVTRVYEDGRRTVVAEEVSPHAIPDAAPLGSLLPVVEQADGTIEYALEYVDGAHTFPLGSYIMKVVEPQPFERELQSAWAEIQRLPTGTADAALKRAALEWLVDDAYAAREARLSSEVASNLDDIAALLGMEDVGVRQHPPESILPPVPHFERNPYVPPVLEKARAALTGRSYKRGLLGYREFTTPQEIREEFVKGGRLIDAVWAFVYPESPLAGDPVLLKQVLRALQAIFDIHRNGDFLVGRENRDWNMNRFIWADVFEAYLLLDAAYPNIIPPSKQERWRRDIRAATEFQIATHGNGAQSATVSDGPGWYPNMDAYYMLMLGLAGEIFDEPRYRAEAERFVALLGERQYPDGGFTYMGLQNESGGIYHDIVVSKLARWWQLSGSSAALALIERSASFHPLMVEPGGAVEFYTAPFWKQQWTRKGPAVPEIVAGITKDPATKGVAAHLVSINAPDQNGATEYFGAISILAASLYDESIPALPLRDGYIVYDENVQGPRGRFGRWSFAGTGRDLQDRRGKNTYVGAMVAAEPNSATYIDGALQVVGNEYHTSSELHWLSQDERSDSTVLDDLAALTTHYRFQLTRHGGSASSVTDWVGTEQWLMMPERMIGMLDILPLGDQVATAIQGRIRFGDGRTDVPLAAIEQLDENTWAFGSLRLRIHDHNYGGVIRGNVWLRSNSAQGRYAELLLRDEAALAQSKDPRFEILGHVINDLEPSAFDERVYPDGTRHYFVVEVWPAWNEPTEAVETYVTDEGLRVLEVSAGGARYRLIHNPTDESQRYVGDEGDVVDVAAHKHAILR